MPITIMNDIIDNKFFSKEISQRFIQAMDRIMSDRSNGKITAQIFGEQVGIASSNINRIRTNPDTHFVTTEAIGRLCYYYPQVSATWLITGASETEGLEDVLSSLKKLESRVKGLEKKAPKPLSRSK